MSTVTRFCTNEYLIGAISFQTHSSLRGYILQMKKRGKRISDRYRRSYLPSVTRPQVYSTLTWWKPAAGKSFLSSSLKNWGLDQKSFVVDFLFWRWKGVLDKRLFLGDGFSMAPAARETCIFFYCRNKVDILTLGCGRWGGDKKGWKGWLMELLAGKGWINFKIEGWRWCPS